MKSCLMTTVSLNLILGSLKANECDVDRDNDAGTVVAKDGETTVFWAIQKGRNQPWIARFAASDRIKWGDE